MEIGASLFQNGSTNYNHLNNAQNKSYLANEDSQDRYIQESLDQEDEVFGGLDAKANKILDSLLADRIENERYAIKSIIETALSGTEGYLSKDEMLRRLDSYIEEKKNGYGLEDFGLLNVALQFKKLYESDFTPINLSA